MQFDASGRSTGNASVWYASEADAQTAVVEFDGAKAKGEPIQVKVLGTSRIARGGRAARGRGQRTPSLMDRMQGAPASRGHARPEKRRGAQRKERRGPASAASLDAELDAFMNAPSETNNGVCSTGITDRKPRWKTSYISSSSINASRSRRFFSVPYSRETLVEFIQPSGTKSAIFMSRNTYPFVQRLARIDLAVGVRRIFQLEFFVADFAHCVLDRDNGKKLVAHLVVPAETLCMVCVSSGTYRPC